MVQTLWRAFCWFLNKLNIELTYDTITALLGINLKEWKRDV